MEKWIEIRRRVLLGEISQRQACREYSLGWRTLKKILAHEQPATLLPLPPQQVPSRGWGEDFWVQVTDRQQGWFTAVVDNPLYEARLHGLELGSEVVFHEDHVLAVHGSHREELVLSMESDDLRQFVEWLGSLPE